MYIGLIIKGPPSQGYHHVSPETKKDMTHSLRKCENLQACLVVVVVVVVVVALFKIDNFESTPKK